MLRFKIEFRLYIEEKYGGPFSNTLTSLVSRELTVLELEGLSNRIREALRYMQIQPVHTFVETLK